MQTGLQDRDESRKEADQLLAVDAMRNAEVWASVAMEVVIKCHIPWNNGLSRCICLVKFPSNHAIVLLDGFVSEYVGTHLNLPDFPIAPCHET